MSSPVQSPALRCTTAHSSRLLPKALRSGRGRTRQRRARAADGRRGGVRALGQGHREPQRIPIAQQCAAEVSTQSPHGGALGAYVYS